MYTITAKTTLISPIFLVWNFCGKAQFLHSVGNCAFPQPHQKIK